MITVFGRQYPDLPQILMQCPRCKSGQLAWDGKKWACDAGQKVRRQQDNYVDGHCNRGFTLGGLFAEDEVVGSAFQVGRVDVARLRLTAEAYVLVVAGTITLPFADDKYLKRQAAGVERQFDRLQFHAWRQLMEEKPGIEKAWGQ